MWYMTGGKLVMKRYYILVNKNGAIDKHFYSLWFNDTFLIVPTKGEPIGDNLFYRARKWYGKVWYWLYDAPTGTYICRMPTLNDLKYHVESDAFKRELDRVRHTKFYSAALKHFEEAMERRQHANN